MRKTASSAFICLLFLFFTTAVSPAGEYHNSRFGFRITYPDSWERYKSPPPANNDGISFILPEKTSFSASAMHNVQENSLEREIKERADCLAIFSNEKITMGGRTGRRILAGDRGNTTLIACVMGPDNAVIYSIYFTAPENIFPRYRGIIDKILKSVRISD